MSIIVATQKAGYAALACDTQSYWGEIRINTDNHRCVKYRKIGASLVGSTGWGLYDNILDDYLAGRKDAITLLDSRSIFNFFLRLWKELHDKYTFVNDQCDKESDSPFGNIDASFLIVNKNGIFHVDSDLSVNRFEKYYAIGAGEDFALGALYSLYDTDLNAGDLARRAVEAAINFSTRCGGEIECEQVKLTPKPQKG